MDNVLVFCKVGMSIEPDIELGLTDGVEVVES